MSGFRGIFLDSIHPLIRKRLETHITAYQFQGVSSAANIAQMQGTTFNSGFNFTVTGDPATVAEGKRDQESLYRYFQERTSWIRVAPFAIPEDEFTTNSNLFIANPEDLAVPNWRDYVIYGGKAIEHSPDEDGDNFYYDGDFSHGNAGFSATDKGLYRRNSFSWRGERTPGYAQSPIPGITQLSVSNKGDLGTIRRASFDIKVHNAADLEAIEMMYMIPGMSVLIEWGWYHPQFYMDPIDLELITDGQPLTSTKNINIEILKKSFGLTGEFGDDSELFKIGYYENQANSFFGKYGPRAGIYDGLLGIVTKFSWTNDGQGGYDCRVDCISPGSLSAGIPAESFVLGGAIVADGKHVQVSDIRTIHAYIKKETKAIANIQVGAEDAAEAKKRYNKIRLGSPKSVEAKRSDSSEKATISVKKLETSNYGIKISADADGNITFSEAEISEQQGTDYYLQEYAGSERQVLTPIKGDRHWWNKVIAYVSYANKGLRDQAGINRNKALKGDIDMSKFTDKFAQVDKLADHMDQDRASKIFTYKGLFGGAKGGIAAIEKKFGAQLRAGNYYVTKNDKFSVYVKKPGSNEYTDNGSVEDWAARLWGRDDDGIKEMFQNLGGKYKPRMEKSFYPDGTKAADKKYVNYVESVDGVTTLNQNVSSEGNKGNGWTQKDGKIIDKSGKEVQWGTDKYMSQQKITGTVVYTKDDSGNYQEVASFTGENAISPTEIKNRFKTKAKNADNQLLEDKQKELDKTIKKDAELVGMATNMGFCSWANSERIAEGNKPFFYGEDGTENKMVYADVYPKYAPPINISIDGKPFSSELGYTMFPENAGFPIGSIAYGNTYVSWRFVEDYIINELYMPKSSSPGTDNNDNANNESLETVFFSGHRLSDTEKQLMFATEENLRSQHNIEFEDDELSILTEESAGLQIFKPTYIINASYLRSHNPEVCILPGQESIPTLPVAEGVEAPPIGSDVSSEMLDGVGIEGGIATAKADPLLRYDTAINIFAGYNENGKIDYSSGNLRNLMINIDLILEMSEKAKDVKGFCLSILNECNKACGEPWSFKILTNSTTGQISVIDENYTGGEKTSAYIKSTIPSPFNEKTGVFYFSGNGLDNITKDIKIQSKIPSELASMAYYSTLGSDNSKGSAIQMFQMYGIGIVDRLKKLSNVTVIGNETGSVETRQRAETDLLQSYAILLAAQRNASATQKQESDSVDEGVKIAKQFVRKYIHGNTVEVGTYRPPIPIDVSLELEGISGLYMGNAIGVRSVDEGGILPSRYKNTVALQITSVDHTINPEGWTTSIGTLMRPLPDAENTPTITVKPRASVNVISTTAPTEAALGNPFGKGNIYKVNSWFGSKEDFRTSPTGHGGADFNNPNDTQLLCIHPEATLICKMQGLNGDKKGGSGGLNRGDGYGYYTRTTGRGFPVNGKKERLKADYGHLNYFADPENPSLKMQWPDLKNNSNFINKGSYFQYYRKVKFGELIAWSGGSKGATGAGNSLGPHLHLTIKKGSTNVQPFFYIDDYLGTEYKKQPKGRNLG